MNAIITPSKHEIAIHNKVDEKRYVRVTKKSTVKEDNDFTFKLELTNTSTTSVSINMGDTNHPLFYIIKLQFNKVKGNVMEMIIDIFEADDTMDHLEKIDIDSAIFGLYKNDKDPISISILTEMRDERYKMRISPPLPDTLDLKGPFLRKFVFYNLQLHSLPVLCLNSTIMPLIKHPL